MQPAQRKMLYGNPSGPGADSSSSNSSKSMEKTKSFVPGRQGCQCGARPISRPVRSLIRVEYRDIIHVGNGEMSLSFFVPKRHLDQVWHLQPHHFLMCANVGSCATLNSVTARKSIACDWASKATSNMGPRPTTLINSRPPQAMSLAQGVVGVQEKMACRALVPSNAISLMSQCDR